MPSDKSWYGRDETFTTFFNKIDAIKFVPHCMFLDLRSTVIDEVIKNWHILSSYFFT